MIDREILDFDLLICLLLLMLDIQRELFYGLIVLVLLALSDFLLLFLLGNPKVDAERFGSAKRSLVI